MYASSYFYIYSCLKYLDSLLRLLCRKQVSNTKGYSGSINIRSGVKNILINNFTPCNLSNISNVECMAVIPKSVGMVTMLLFVFFVLLSAGMVPDKSAVVALRGGGGSGHPSFDGVPGFGGLPGPGGLPTFGGLPVPSGGAPSHIDSGSGFHSRPSSLSPTKIHPTNNLNSGDHKNISPNNVHPNNNNNNINPNNNLSPKNNGQNNLRPNNAAAVGRCTGYGASINPCGPNPAPRRDNLNPAEQHCTGYGISVNPCGNHPVDPCLVNPCPISPCVINPCPPSYGRIIVGGDSSTNSYSSSPVIVKDEQSSDTSSNNNQAQGSSPDTIPIANAGSNMKVHSFDHITLDGRKSYDPDGKKLTYSWRQLAGVPIVLLSDDQNVKPTFEAPQATEIDITLTFQLIVNNGNADSNPASVTITVQPL
jgi:K319-like protein